MRVLVFILCLGISLTSAFAKGGSSKVKPGWRESYGGDVTISEFQSIAREVFEAIKYENLLDLRIAPHQYYLLRETIDTASVACGGRLELDGDRKDAINFPFQTPQKILLDCSNWNSYLTYSNKVRLVIHEYLSLVFIDDSGYDYSSRIVRWYFQNVMLTDKIMFELVTGAMECDAESYHSLLELSEDPRYKGTVDIGRVSNVVFAMCPDITRGF